MMPPMNTVGDESEPTHAVPCRALCHASAQILVARIWESFFPSRVCAACHRVVGNAVKGLSWGPCILRNVMIETAGAR